MEEPITEKIFSLEEIDYTRFWGDNDKILDFVRILFPKLKIIARGDMLKVVGSAEDIDHFDGKLQAMKTYYDKVGRLNENVIMQIFENGGSTPEAETNEEILVHGRNGLLVRARTPNQRRLVEAVKENDMVFAIGPAGTGKTYTAVALAVRALKNKEIRRIILTRPAVEAGENLGFLPGDLRDKLDPYLQPLYDALRDMIPQQKLLSYWEDNTIEIAPLAFMRGRSQIRHHRRHHPNRPATPPAERSGSGHAHPRRHQRHQHHPPRQQRRDTPQAGHQDYPCLRRRTAAGINLTIPPVMKSHPNCKINLGLHVVGKRPDGYHNLETIFLPVHDLCDELEINPTTASNTTMRQEGILLDNAPGDNLCMKAYRLLQEEFGIPPVEILLHKHIPFGAGLGGGSSDAAFTLRMLNEMFSLGLATADLERRAAQIGADCAFFIQNRPAYATGIGDQLEPIDLDLSAYRIAIEIPPDEHVSTREAYAGLHLQGGSRPDLRQAVRQPVPQWRETIVNDFEASVFPAHPAIAALKDDMYSRGAHYAAMTGSGAAVFGLFPL